jgi:hypothetical protein
MKITIKLESQSVKLEHVDGGETWPELASLFLEALHGLGYSATAQELAEHYGESS